VHLALSDMSVPIAQAFSEIIDSGTSITTQKHKGIFFTVTQTVVWGERFSYRILLTLPISAFTETVCILGTLIPR